MASNPGFFLLHSTTIYQKNFPQLFGDHEALQLLHLSANQELTLWGFLIPQRENVMGSEDERNQTTRSASFMSLEMEAWKSSGHNGNKQMEHQSLMQ